MKLKYKIMLNANVNNLNKIPIEELSWEYIDYALKRGFSYLNAIDDRYDKYINYIIYNLENCPDYLDKLINEHSIVLKNSQIQENILHKICSNNPFDIDKLIKIIKISNDIYYISNFNYIKDISDLDKQKLYEAITDCFNYEDLPENLVKENIKIGKLYLSKNINNMEFFLSNNSNYSNIDEIATLINDNCVTDETFNILFNYLKKYNPSIEVWKKIIYNNRNTIDRISLLYKNFNLRSLIVPEICNNNIVIDGINENNVDIIVDNLLYKEMQEFIIKNNFLDQLINAMKMANYPKYNYYNLIDICIQSNYLLTKDSPEVLKSSYDLVILSLKAGILSINDININNFINDPVEHLMEIVNIGILNKDNNKIIEDLKEIIKMKTKNKIKHNNDNVYYLEFDKLNNENYYEYIVSNIPENVHDIYLEGYGHSYEYSNIKFFDIEKINKLIEAIKKQNKDIKINFSFDINEIISSELLLKIIDPNMVVFNSVKQINRINATEVITLNTTLDLFVEDIKNSNLSPYEKYIAIYNIVKSFKEYKFYKNSESEDFKIGDQSRSIYLIMQNDYMVCVGYANMLKVLLEKVGIDSVSYGWHEGRHQLNYVRIIDEKYGINGIFKSDPTKDNSIGDPINKDYKYINQEIGTGFDNITPFDNFLESSDDSFIDKLSIRQVEELYEYIVQLYGDLGQESDKKRALQSFKQRYISQKSKSIEFDKTIDAILSVKEHIEGRKFTRDETRQQRNYLILCSFPKYREKVDYADDLSTFKNELFNMKIEDYKKIPDSYKKHVFSIIIRQLIEKYNKSNDTNIDLWMQLNTNDLYLVYKNLTYEQETYLVQCFTNMGIETDIRSKENNLIVAAKLNNFLHNENIGDGLFKKISEIQEKVPILQIKTV